MRDVIERNNHVGYTKTYTYVPSVRPGRTLTNNFSDAIVKRAGRSEIQQGNFRSATHYRAYQIDVQTNPFYLRRYDGSAKWYEFKGGKLVVTPYKKYIVSEGKVPIEANTFRFFGLDPYTYEPSINPLIRAECHTKVLNKLNEGKIDLGQTLGELSETTRGLNKTLGQMIRLLIACFTRKPPKGGWPRGAQRNNYAKARKDFFSAKSPAEAWLAIQLFWKPLISDMLNAQAAILDLFNRDEPEVRVEAVVTGPPIGWLYYRHSYTGDIVHGCQMGITATLEESWIVELNKLGVANPLSLGWELLPLSFVADWFVGIGNFLSAATASAGLQFSHGYETHFVRGDARVRRYFLPDGDIRWNARQYEDANGNKMDTFPSWQVRAFAMKRVPLTEFPSARLALGSGLSSSNRALTGTALAYLSGRKAGKSVRGSTVPSNPEAFR